MAALMIVGAVISAIGTIQQGRAANANAKFQAAQLERNASNARATSQRSAAEETRKAGILNSNVLAGAAASGGGTDGSVQNIMGDIAGEGEYRSLTRLYDGEEQARGMEGQASAQIASGKNAQNSSYLSAAGTIASSVGSAMGGMGGGGGGSMFSKYSPSADIGPFDNSLPWRNQPLK